MRVQILKPVSTVNGTLTYTNILSDKMKLLNIDTKSVIYNKNKFALLHVLKNISPNYDIIHVQNLYLQPLIASIMASFLYNEKVVVTAHGPGSWNKNLVERRLARIVLSRVGAIISVSKWVDKKISNHVPRDVPKFVIYPGVDTSTFNPYLYYDFSEDKLGLKDKKVILFVGRLVKIKGIVTLLEAFSRLTYRDSVLLVCGTGRLLISLKKMVHDLKLDDKVIFKGRVPHGILPKYYALCDMCVVPSLFESFGLVVLEAMSMKKPVVATNVGGIPEIIKNNINGLLVKPNDTDALAEAMDKVLQDQRLGIRLGTNARRDIERNFNLDRMIQQTASVYKYVMRS
jgi:glycosyltransferase involved in cell wall biosynthesis